MTKAKVAPFLSGTRCRIPSRNVVFGFPDFLTAICNYPGGEGRTSKRI